jgi:hypothetical protein
MWMQNPDFFIQSSNDLKIIKSGHIQTEIWLANMGFESKQRKEKMTLNIYDSILRCNVLSATLTTKNRPLNWKLLSEN